MKKVFILGVLVLCLFVLGSCGYEAENESLENLLDPADPVTLSLWHYYAGDSQISFENAVDDFNKTIGIEKGIIIDPIGFGSIGDLQEAVMAEAQTDKPSSSFPDIFSSYPDVAKEIDYLDLLCDLDPYFTDEEKDLYIADFLEDGYFGDNRLVLIPIAKSTEVFYLNKTAWDEFTKDRGDLSHKLESWEGLLDVSKEYYQWSGGKAFMGFDSVANYIITGGMQIGAEIIDAEKEQAFIDQDAMRQIFDIYCTGISLGYFDAIGRFRSDDVKGGDLIAYIGSSSGGGYFPTWIEKDNKQETIEMIALAYPVFQNGTKYAAQQGAGMCVSKSETKKELAASMFLKWFTGGKHNIDFSVGVGYLPVQKSAFESGELDLILDNLRAGSQADQNLSLVYDVATDQVLNKRTYAAKPFRGSFDLRIILQETLLEIGLDAKEKVDEDLLETIDMDEIYNQWIKTLKERLDAKNIDY